MVNKNLLSGQEPIRIQSTMSAGGGDSTTITPAASKRSTSTKSHEELLQAQKQKDESGKGGSAAGPQDWANAWKQKQMQQHLANPIKEDHTDPSPLLLDKISSLPPESAERRNAEVLKGVLDNTTANVGYGPDSLTRESYKELKRVVKHSDMLQSSLTESMPSSNQLIGQEEGAMVSNLQSWKPSIANAVQPVSDAIGSHADTNSSITKNALGTEQTLPQTALINVKSVSPTMVSETENPMKGIQKGVLVQTPSKESGSLRHLATSASPTLSVPFDLASDSYSGLMGLINKSAKLLDTIINKITSFLISAAGGLIDSIFPPGMLSALIKLITGILGILHDLFNLLAGFGSLSKMSSQIMNNMPTGCTGNIFGLNRNTSSSQGRRGRKTSALGSVVGGISKVGNSLGNLGFILGGQKGNSNLGALTSNLSHPQQLTDSLFDGVITALLRKLHQMCNVGMVGNRGYSVGNAFDSLTDNAFSKAMQTYAAHASIISPNFNKKSTPVGSYATEASLDMFQQLPYGRGAQGSNGVIMHGPGGTQGRKVFRI